MSPPLLVAALMAAAVLLGWVRLAFWRARAPVRPRGWRLALLLAAQPVVAVLLYLTLFSPPQRAAPRATLVVRTRGAASEAGAVMLPEAGGGAGEAAPDLATALRRHPGTRRIEVRGEGLEARDAEAARGLAIVFDPPPLPRGLAALAPPQQAVAPGAAFRVGGRAQGLDGGSSVLIDPSGTEVDRVPLDRDGGFILSGAARVPGVALFRVRLRDTRGALVEEADAPVRVARAPAVRVLFLAGAPGPEVKYWRRWAEDAGLAATTRVALGAGLELGDTPPPLGVATLSRFDLAIVDERSWAALGGNERAALASAARGGLGLLLRVTGPLPDVVRGAWSGFGLPLFPARALTPARLPAHPGEALPPLTYRAALAPSAADIMLVRGEDGAPLIAWHGVGIGRVGVWTLADAAGLVTAGESARFGEIWGETVAALARAEPASLPTMSPAAREDGRVTLCGTGPGARVLAPGGAATALLLDPVAGGCAGFWPRAPGWHVLATAAGAMPFYVHAASALPAARAGERRDRTLALMRGTPPSAESDPGEARPGRAWPWLLLFLLAAASLWWFERASFGRPR